MMATDGTDDRTTTVNLELLETSKRLVERYEEAYQWMIQLGVHLDPRETVGTLAFAGKGKHKVSHLTWAEIVALHHTYERLDEIESFLEEREIDESAIAPVEAQVTQ